MKIAIIERLKKDTEGYPFNQNFLIDKLFQTIFDELNILLIPVISEKNLDEVANLCDGLILPGSFIGVDPKYYHDVPFPGKEYPYDEYILDKQILDLFVKAKKPILGICGGMQTLNVYFGGTLNQNILHHKLSADERHKVLIEPHSLLYEIYNQDVIGVNSFHRQAVKDLAPGFKITAKSQDGIIEAIERDNVIGVQWHPEALHDIKFFSKFIEKCSFQKKKVSL